MTKSDSTNEMEGRATLRDAIAILERSGVIDFNGHMSTRLGDGTILINTGNSVRSAMTTEDLVVVGADGRSSESDPAPPAELPLHLSIYRSRPDVNAVVHGHPTWSTVISSIGEKYRVTMAQGALLGSVPVYASPRSVNRPEIGDDVAQLLGPGRAVLLRSHGVVVVGDDIMQATVLAIYLELNAERQVKAGALGVPYEFSEQEVAQCQRGLWKTGLFEKCWNYYQAKLSR